MQSDTQQVCITTIKTYRDMKKKITIINCLVENHTRNHREVVPFTTTNESAEFCEFVMETEKLVYELFFGKDMEIVFDNDAQTMKLVNKTDDEVIITITISVHKNVEVEL